MHSYLRSIGFSKLERKELDQILKEVITQYDEKTVIENSEGHLFVEVSKIFGCDFGITVCGEYDENNEFEMEYYFPFFRGTGITTQENVLIERHAGKESYAGAVDDVRIGVTIIFYLQNAAEYLTEHRHGHYTKGVYPVTLAGLAREARILLPVKKDEKQQREERENTVNRNRMIAAARNGDEEAMENLTMEDIDTYSMISGRIANEDIYSIVDTYFMPYGMECDLYNIMGEITEWSITKNTLTNEEIYQIRISCNDMEMDICVNAKDLLGEPEVGRRFKGVIWLQGNVDF